MAVRRRDRDRRIYLEGLVVIVWLADKAQHIEKLHRVLRRLHAPRFDAWFEKWGIWVGMLVGTAIEGPEPVIIALVWLGAPPKKLLVPLFVQNVLYTVISWDREGGRQHDPELAFRIRRIMKRGMFVGALCLAACGSVDEKHPDARTADAAKTADASSDGSVTYDTAMAVEGMNTFAAAWGRYEGPVQD